MPPVPLLRPNQVVKVFEKFGWQVDRKKGSHIIMTKEGHIATLSIPNHPQVARGTLRSLIQKSGLTIDQFIEAIQ
jgi:predicted RNA binding protein YcfA (HicA-like mRNA interferase family)